MRIPASADIGRAARARFTARVVRSRAQRGSAVQAEYGVARAGQSKEHEMRKDVVDDAIEGAQMQFVRVEMAAGEAASGGRRIDRAGTVVPVRGPGRVHGHCLAAAPGPSSFLDAD